MSTENQPDRKTIVAALVEVARAAHALADNTADDHTIPAIPEGALLCDSGDMDKLSQMLDVLGQWPDPPGEWATGPRKAEHWYSENAEQSETQSPGSLERVVSEERILQLSNDLNEGIESGSIKEWRAVALYFRTELDKLTPPRSSLAALTIAEKMRSQAMLEIAAWVKAQSDSELKGFYES